ncbi:hypothetical protein C0416_04270 [bacterium]|nr:hypothetical protein [bacterium]
MPKLFYQFGTRYLEPHMGEDNTLFAEWNMVFLAKGGQGGPGRPGGSGGNGKPSEGVEREQSGPAGDGAEEQSDEIKKLTARIAERAHSVIDVWEYEFPADIDPDRIKEARKVVNEYHPLLKKSEEKVDESIESLLGEMGVVGNQEAHDKLWGLIYGVVPEFTQERLRKNGEFDISMVSSKATAVMVEGIKQVWEQYSQKNIDVPLLKGTAEILLYEVYEIAKNEFEMLKTVDQVREVLWDMHDKLQKKSIEQRLIKSATRDSGIPLRVGQELQGFGRKLKPGFKEDEPFIEKLMRRWIVKEVSVDKKVMNGPEKEKEEMILTGVWVTLEEKGSGKVSSMSTNRLRDFIALHEITPVVNRQRSLKENVIYLSESEMNIDVKAGSTLEYDEIKVNPATKKPDLEAQKVKVLSIDDSGVKLSKPVLYRSLYDSPDLDDNEYKSDLTLGEFAKWMNQRRPVPTMELGSLRAKLVEHYKYMNSQYKRVESCHAQILLDVGEILHADAPGNPLFEVESVDELNGIIKLKKNRIFTFTQFLRWVYENDIEPYSPGLEAKKMKTYFKAGDTDVLKAETDAKSTIEYFQKDDVWRDTLKKLREKGLTGAEPRIELRGDSPIGVEKQSYSMLGQWLKDTQWLRLDDIFALFKTGWEYYLRNWQRRQKLRYSSVGKNVPFFANEFERINQNAETEEMQQFKDAMDQWGIPQIEDVMYKTNNRDQLKACFNALAPKGMLRWDDIRLYNAINKFTDINHKVPIPAGDPYKKFGPGSGTCNGIPLEGKNVTDFLPAAIDSMWGEGSYVGWKRQNDDTIESAISQTYRKANELEADPKNSGGIGRELSNLLTKHMNGEWVDQTEFEGLLRFCIEYGKTGGKHKAYYLIMGATAKNPDGRTLIGWERLGHFVTKYCNQFPALDFFSAANRDPKRDFATGEIFDTAYVRSDFDAITERWSQQARANNGIYEPGPDAEEFFRHQMLTSDAVQIRLEKGIRAADKMDHDDSPYFIPALKDSEIANVCSAAAGTTKKFTIQGYKNAYIGFGMRMKALASKYEEEKVWEGKGEQGFSAGYVQKLIVAFKAYMHYDGIMDNRFRKKSGSSLQRLGSSDYQTGCVWDGSRPLRKYQDEMKQVIKEVAVAYGHGDDPNIVDLPFRKGAPESAIANFGPLLESIVQSDDKGAKLVEVINKHNFLFETKVEENKEIAIRTKARMYEYDASDVSADSLVADSSGDDYVG